MDALRIEAGELSTRRGFLMGRIYIRGVRCGWVMVEFEYVQYACVSVCVCGCVCVREF